MKVYDPLTKKTHTFPEDASVEEIEDALNREHRATGSVGEADPSMLSEQTTSFGKMAEALSATNYMAAQGVSAALKGEPILPAMKRGITLQEPKVFGDVLEENMPYAFADPTTSAVIQTVGGLVGDIALDPLTYAGGIGKLLAKLPGAKQAGQAVRGIAKKAVEPELVKDAASLFTTAAEPKAYQEAYDVLKKYKDIQHYRSGQAVQEMADLDRQIVKLAKETGENAHSIRARIVDSVEQRMMTDNPTVNEIIDFLKRRNLEQLEAEQALGLGTKEVAKNVEDFSGIDYFIHAVTPEGKTWLEKRGGKEFKGISRQMTDKHASMIKRKFGEMSVADVNNYARANGMRGDFFMTDVARAQAIRDIRHVRAITGAEFYDEMGRNFGRQAGESGAEGFVKVKPDRLKDYVFDPEVAKVIDSHYEKFLNPDNVNSVLRLYDRVQNWWKTWTLGIFPAYHTRNMMGNFWNNFLAGIHSPVPYKVAMDMQRGARGTLKTVLGDLSYDDVMRIAGERGVLGGKGFYGGDIPSAIDDALIKGKWLTIGRSNKVVKTGMRLGTAIEENARLAHFIDKLQKGMDADAAAKSVKKFLFDYTDITEFERNVMKRALPFYTWSRKNIPLQMEMFLRKPGKQVIPIKLKHEIERLSEKDKPPPEVNIGEFLQGDYAFRVSGRDAEGNFKYVPIAGYLPWGDVARFMNSPAENLAFMVSPIVKEPIQQITNYDLYFRREIATKNLRQGFIFPDEGEEFTRFMGIRLTPRAAHVLRNIRLLATVHRANPFQVFGETTMGQEEMGTGQKMAQYILGLRNYEVNEVRALVRGLYSEKRKINDLRKEYTLLASEIARAERAKKAGKEPSAAHLKDIQDRLKIITNAINEVSTKEIPKHIRK